MGRRADGLERRRDDGPEGQPEPKPGDRVVAADQPAPLIATALAVGLGGCGTALTRSAPHPDRPEIASVSQEASRVRSGCPIKLRFAFRDAEANVTRALASWAYEGSAGLGGQPMRTVSPPSPSIVHR